MSADMSTGVCLEPCSVKLRCLASAPFTGSLNPLLVSAMKAFFAHLDVPVSWACNQRDKYDGKMYIPGCDKSSIV